MKAVKEDFSEQKNGKESEIFAEPIAREIEPTVTKSAIPASNGLTKKRLIIGVGLCVAIAVGGKSLISNVGRHNAKTRLPSSAQTSRNIKATGTVVAQELLNVLPQATDLQIKQVLVKEGERVKAGQLMAVFDDSVLQAQVEEARGKMNSSQALVIQKQAAVRQAEAEVGKEKAGLVQAEAGLGKTKAGLVQAQAGLGETEANLAKAKSERGRYQFLATEGAISLQDLESRSTDATAFGEQVRSAQAAIDSSNAEVSNAQAAVGAAQAKLGAAQANVSSAQADLDSAKANLSSSKAQIQQLQTQRERTQLRAPANGLVMERIAQVGDVTSYDRKLFSLVRDSSFQLQTQIEEYELPGIRIGAPVILTSESDKRIRLPGKILAIAPAVDSQTHQPIVKIGLPPSPLLRSGMVLHASIAAANGYKPPQLTNTVKPASQ